MKTRRLHHSFFWQTGLLSLLALTFVLSPRQSISAWTVRGSDEISHPMPSNQLSGNTNHLYQNGDDAPKPEPEDDSVEAASISGISMPGSPLEIVVYSDGSLSLREAGRNHFYGSRASGFFLWIGSAVYGPSVPAGGSHIAYTTVAHQGPFGSGTTTDPWRVISTFKAGTPEITIQQVVAYVNGARHIDFWWQLVNTGGNSNSISLFHAADLYVDGNDYGRGYRDQNTRAVGGYNISSGIYGIFTPITAPDAYEENSYATIWNSIGGTTRGIGFQNSIRSEYIDNGAGLQWNLGRMGVNANSIVTSRFSVTPQNTSTPDLESPPTASAVQANSLPGLREFEFGTRYHTSTNQYGPGPFEFNVPISRYYGDFKAERASLTVKAFDVDSPNERYALKVNGRSDCNVSGELRGVNGGWRSTTFDFDARCLNFPNLPINLAEYRTRPIPLNVSIESATNTFQLIPVANGQVYSTLISYAQLRVQGARPVLFGHGLDNGCSGNTRSLGRWEEWVNGSNLPGLGALVDGSFSLEGQINQWEMSYQEMKRVFGLRDKNTPGVSQPDRIILAGHSMGGLAGRGFVNRQHDSDNFIVESLVAFATPNDGNDLSGWASGVGCSRSALHDLASGYIRDTFNPQNNLSTAWAQWASYGGNSSAAAHMTSIAARYNIRANDSVVWVDEVHVLPYDRDELYRWDDDADDGENISFECRNMNPTCGLHSQIPQFESIYRRIRGIASIGEIVQTLLQSIDSLSAHPQISEPSTAIRTESAGSNGTEASTLPFDRQSLGILAASISPNSENRSAFMLDEAGYLVLQPTIANTTNETITFTLIAPDGARFPAEGANLYLENPMVGLWFLEVASGGNGGDYSVLLVTSSNLVLNPLPSTESQRNVVQGTDANLGIKVQDGGNPLLGLTVAATIQSPNGQNLEVELNDLGQNGDALANDGTYSIVYPTNNGTPTGSYIVSYRVQGNRADGRPFQRIANSGFTVITGVGIAANAIQWTTQDENDDSLIDVVYANVVFSPPAVGSYELIGNLRNNLDGTVIGQSASKVSVSADQVGVERVVALEFGGSNLGGLQVELQVSLVDLKLYYLGVDSPVLDASNTNEPTLFDYLPQTDGSLSLTPNTLQGPLLLATVSGYSLPDANANNRAEMLRFYVDIFSRFGAAYTLQATLQDNTGQSVAFTEQGVQLGAGWQRVPLDFDAASIVQNGITGQFVLSNLSVMPVDQGNLQAGSLDMVGLYTTEILSLDDFEGFVSLSISTNIIESQGYVRVSPANADGVYPTSTEVMLEAIVIDPDMIFDHWSVNGIHYREQPLRIMLNEETRIDAVFGHPQLSGTASPSTIIADGVSHSIIEFFLSNTATSEGLPERVIHISTTLGVLDVQIVTTTVAGNATVTLTSGTQPGTATVTATYDDLYTGTVQLAVMHGSPTSMSIIAEPNVLLADGVSTTILTAVVKDVHGNPVPNQTVAFASTLGAITSATTTDANGKATAILTSVQQVGKAQVTAAVGALSASTEVTLAGSIFAGVVYVDRNQNGLRDANEPGLANVAATMTLVSLAEQGAQAQAAAVGATWRTVSDANGIYRFTELPLGVYTLTLRFPATFVATSPTTHTVTVGSGQGAAPDVGGLARLYLPSVRR